MCGLFYFSISFILHEWKILSFLQWIHQLYQPSKTLLNSISSIKNSVPHYFSQTSYSSYLLLQILFIFYMSIDLQLRFLWFYNIGWTFPEFLNSGLWLTILTRPWTKSNFLIYFRGKIEAIAISLICLMEESGVFFSLMEKIEPGHCAGTCKYYNTTHMLTD